MKLLPPGRSFELSRDLLVDAIDIHVHAGPHIFSSPRRVDPFEAAGEALAAGMRALVYMDVFEMSCGTSWLVNRWLERRRAMATSAREGVAGGGAAEGPGLPQRGDGQGVGVGLRGAGEPVGPVVTPWWIDSGGRWGLVGR